MKIDTFELASKDTGYGSALRRAAAALDTGELERAVAGLESARGGFEDQPQARAWLALGLAQAHVRGDDPDVAGGWLARARTEATEGGTPEERLAVAVGLLSGALAAIRDDLDGAEAAFSAVGVAVESAAPAACVGRARVALRRGDHDSAERLLDEAGDTPASAGLGLWPSARLLHAHIATARGALDEAEAGIARLSSATWADRVGAALARARLHRARWARSRAARDLLLAVRSAEVALSLARSGAHPMALREALLHRAAARALSADGAVAAADARRALGRMVHEERLVQAPAAPPEWPASWLLCDAAQALEAGSDPLVEQVRRARDRSLRPGERRRAAELGVVTGRPRTAERSGAGVGVLDAETLAPLMAAGDRPAVLAAAVAAAEALPGVVGAALLSAPPSTPVDFETIARDSADEQVFLTATLSEDAVPEDREPLSALAALVGAALERVGEAERRTEVLEAELRRRERAQLRLARELRRPSRRTVVAVEENMVALVTRLKKLARVEGWVLLEGETGVGRSHLLAALARWMDGARLWSAEEFLDLASTSGWAAAGEAVTETASAIDDAHLLPEEAWAALVESGPGLPRVVVSAPSAAAAELLPWLREAVGEAGARVQIPPLRDRPADIPLLADLLLRAGTPPRKQPPGLTSRGLAALLAHSWPGNVRELRWVLTRAAAGVEGTIPPDAIEPLLGRGAPADGLLELARAEGYHGAVAACRRRIIEEALRTTGGHRTRAAELLGLQRTYLARLIRELEVEAPARDGRSGRPIR